MGGVAKILLAPTVGYFLDSVMERNRGHVIHMHEGLQSRIRRHYAASSQRLAGRLNCILKNYGY